MAKKQPERQEVTVPLELLNENMGFHQELFGIIMDETPGQIKR